MNRFREEGFGPQTCAKQMVRAMGSEDAPVALDVSRYRATTAVTMPPFGCPPRANGNLTDASR